MDEEAFLQAAVEAMTLLDGVRLRTYLPVPDRGASTTDDQIARVCGMLAAATAEQRASFRGSLSDHERTVLGRYGHRAATLAAFGWHERPTPHGPSFVPTWLPRGEWC
jgi:hypothetical protein